MGSNSLRKCNTCGLEAIVQADLDDFVASKDSRDGRRNVGRKCHYRTAKPQDPQKVRDWKTNPQVKRRYGIHRETYIERMETSAVCECSGTDKDLCYDHCHETMAFRGVLCRNCNRAIGQLGDTLESLETATAYLRRHYEKS